MARRIFISYRRGDAPEGTRRLYQLLVHSFGPEKIFIDREQIEGGDTYSRILNEEVSFCQVFLAVIGPNWLKLGRWRRRRRADHETDWVRKEIERALARGVPVIPVLVDGASMPLAKDLPDGLKELAEQQWLQLPETTADLDARNFVQVIRNKLSLPRIADIEDVKRWGWDGVRLLDALISLDYEVIGEEKENPLDPRNEGTNVQWAPLFWQHPDTWRLIVDEQERILGYWQMHALTKAAYELARRGKLVEGTLKLSMLRFLERDGDAHGNTYNVYCSMIGLRETYRPRLRRLLFQSMFATLDKLAAAMRQAG